MKKTNQNKKIIIGWIISALIFFIISFWTYWGINEAFHEGWYHESILQNLLVTFIQYLSVPIIFLILSLIGLNYRKIGSGLFMLLGIFALFFFDSNAGRLLIFIPLMLFAFGLYYGEYKHKKIIMKSYIAVFLLIVLSFGIPQLFRVENRFNDNDFGIRTIKGNNVELAWAPQGEGFPKEGTNWQTAKDNCARLDEQGTKIGDEETNIWRLPSRDEIVRSMTRNNANSLGVIDSEGNAEYKIMPDKETPLWNPHTKIIYYWTIESDQNNEKKAYLVSYNGRILSRTKTNGANYHGYRCVKEV